MFNNAWLVSELEEELEQRTTLPGSRAPRVRRKIPSSFCLVERLPSTAFIRREASRLPPLPPPPQEEDAEEDNADNSATITTPPPSPPPKDAPPSPVSPTTPSKAGLLATFATKVFKGSGPKSPVVPAAGWKEPQAWEVLKAIERKDIMFLMEVRDRAFHLLLRRTGDSTTPLLHAIRIGAKDIAIILTGAMSRFVNHLEDADMDRPGTKPLLKALRANLKLAIDHSLVGVADTGLIASYLQVLVMSESERWLNAQVQLISLELRAARDGAGAENDGAEGRPVGVAEEAVMKFATRELGKAKGLIAAVDDYVANATADLLILAAWSQVLDRIPGATPIPTYTFARDDRTYRAFTQRLSELSAKGEVTSVKLGGRRLYRQVKVLERVLEGRQETMRRKVEALRAEFDG